MTKYDWIVAQNEFKVQYIEFIEEKISLNRGYKRKPKHHLHHIKPRHYFLDNNLEVDNSDENLVLLTPAEHAYAHFLLCKATDNYKDHCALWRTTRGLEIKTIEDLEFLNDYVYPKHTEENLLKMRGIKRTKEQKEVYREKSKNNSNAKGHKVSQKSREHMSELKMGTEPWNKNLVGSTRERKRSFFNENLSILEKETTVTKICKKYNLGVSSMSMLANKKKQSFRGWVCLDNLQPSQRQEILDSLEGSEIMG